MLHIWKRGSRHGGKCDQNAGGGGRFGICASALPEAAVGETVDWGALSMPAERITAVPPTSTKPIEDQRIRIAIACQGGGSHTAFTAGLLAGLLTNDEFWVHHR